GARPEEGVNAIEVAAALVDGLKRIWISPTESASIKLTKLQAGGESSNIIPGNATFSIDARAQKNETMETLTAAFEKVVRAVSTMYDVNVSIVSFFCARASILNVEFPGIILDDSPPAC